MQSARSCFGCWCCCYCKTFLKCCKAILAMALVDPQGQFVHNVKAYEVRTSMFPTLLLLLLLRQIHLSPIGFWLLALATLWLIVAFFSDPHTTVVVDQLWRLKDVALQQPAWRKLQLHKINKMKTLKLVVVVEVVAWNVRLGSSSSRLNAFFYCFDSNYSACHFWKQLWNRRGEWEWAAWWW